MPGYYLTATPLVGNYYADYVDWLQMKYVTTKGQSYQIQYFCSILGHKWQLKFAQ